MSLLEVDALEAGYDVFIEKPAFLRKEQVEAAFAIAKRSTALLVEMFMYRHTNLYWRLLEWWNTCQERVVQIDINFLIPTNPAGTFRQENDIESSCLYDIGCYPLSLLADLELPVDRLALAAVAHPDDPAREMVELGGDAGGRAVRARIGIDAEYKNLVSFRMRDGSAITYRPFFYGRPGSRRITSDTTGSVTETILEEGNAFERMFAVDRTIWRRTQAERMRTALAVTKGLERLASELRTVRSGPGVLERIRDS